LEAAGGAGLGEFGVARERSSRAHSGAGEFGEAAAAAARTAATTSHQTRQAEQPLQRRGYERHGGAQGTDFQLKAPRGAREVAAEVLVQPLPRAGNREGGDRSALPVSREARPPRVAKSPMKAQREFLRDRVRLFSEPSSRCEEVATSV
jgi:hypothetical protein